MEYRNLNPEIRRAKEVALVRHGNLVTRGKDGSLDYHTEDVQKERKRKKCVREEKKKSLVEKVRGLVLKVLDR